MRKAALAKSPAAFRRLCVETKSTIGRSDFVDPAAFRRLCVETSNQPAHTGVSNQPPSGGCVLKHPYLFFYSPNYYQPPSGGCVLKPPLLPPPCIPLSQPPSGGCVLKQQRLYDIQEKKPAAFRRLCVETCWIFCDSIINFQPPSGGCVLKLAANDSIGKYRTSRLQAAVC